MEEIERMNGEAHETGEEKNYIKAERGEEGFYIGVFQSGDSGGWAEADALMVFMAAS